MIEPFLTLCLKNGVKIVKHLSKPNSFFDPKASWHFSAWKWPLCCFTEAEGQRVISHCDHSLWESHEPHSQPGRLAWILPLEEPSRVSSSTFPRSAQTCIDTHTVAYELLLDAAQRLWLERKMILFCHDSILKSNSNPFLKI